MFQSLFPSDLENSPHPYAEVGGSFASPRAGRASALLALRGVILILALQAVGAWAGLPYPLFDPSAADSNGAAVTIANPTQPVRIFGGTASIDEGVAGNTNLHVTFTFNSVSGATVDGPLNLYYLPPLSDGKQPPHYIYSLPFSFTADTDQVSCFYGLWVKPGQLTKQGTAPPIVLKMTLDCVNTSGDYSQLPPHLHQTCTFTLPVAQVPGLTVTGQGVTSEPGGILHPGESVDYSFSADAAGLTMSNLTFKATIPKGTTVIAGTISPSPSAQSATELVWLSPGNQTTFTSSFSVKCASRPGTTSAITTYGAATRVEDYPRSATGTNKIPIEAFSQGKIDYYTSQNVKDAPVAVDDVCEYVVSGWDWYAGDVAVSLNGISIGTATETTPSGSFTVPVFKDADLESVLTAEQTGKPVDMIVTGAVAAVAELVSSSVVMVDGNGVVVRKLAPGGKVANGEVVTTSPASPSQLGHLRLDGADSGVVLRYTPQPGLGSDGRLVFARQGDVFVYGPTRLSAIDIVSGASLSYNRQDLTGYNTSSNTGVQSVTSSSLAGDTTLSGPVYASDAVTIAGNVTLNGAICYFAGDVTVTGSVTGTGSIVCIGKLTVASGATMQYQSAAGGVALGVGGTLVIEP